MTKFLPTVIFIFSFQAFSVERPSSEKITISGHDGTHPYKLNSILLKPPTKYFKNPLVIFAHGAPASATAAKNFSLDSLLPITTAFLDMGYAVALVERRGFGTSTEPYAEDTGPCDHKDYPRSIHATDQDFGAMLDYYSSRMDIDGKKIAVVGHSAGGYGAVEFARTRNTRLKGVVSFAGLRGLNGQGGICDLSAFKKTISNAGESSNIPELWIFSKNDHVFLPTLGEELWKVFTAAGGNADFWLAPPYREEGHYLISSEGAPLWRDKVRNFLISIFK